MVGFPEGMFGADENARLGYIDPDREWKPAVWWTNGFRWNHALHDRRSQWAEHWRRRSVQPYPAAVMPDFKDACVISLVRTMPSVIRRIIIRTVINRVSSAFDESFQQSLLPTIMKSCTGLCRFTNIWYWQLPTTGGNSYLCSLQSYEEWRWVTAKSSSRRQIILLKEDIALHCFYRWKGRFSFYLRIPSWTKGGSAWMARR